MVSLINSQGLYVLSTSSCVGKNNTVDSEEVCVHDKENTYA